jgi:hypothetical protein
MLIGGSGEVDSECRGSGCIDFDDADYDEDSGFGFGADFMGHVTPQLRLGGGFLFVPSTRIDLDRGPDYDLGSDLALQVVVEGVFDVGPKLALAVRGQGGLIGLFVGGDLEDQIDEDSELCRDASFDCKVAEGPFFGWTLGGGAGVILDLGRVALRADLMLSWYRVKVYGASLTLPTGSEAELTQFAGGNRVLLMAGLEF